MIHHARKVCLLGVALISWATPVTAQNYTWTTNNGAITITSYSGPGGALTIPSTMAGLPVTSIGAIAFEYSRLASVTIPSGVTSIGSSAFQNCNLTNITIPSSVTTIGPLAFANSGLISVTIPSSVTSIGTVALQGCSNLTTITVDVSNPSYSSADGVLFNKNQTTLIQYPASRTGAYAIPDGVTSIGASAFKYSGLTSVTIPSSVTSIGDYAFGFTLLTSLTLPNSVTSIGFYTFEFSGLTSIALPNSVTSIGDTALANCSNLTTITVGASNPSYSSAGGVLFNKNQTTLIQCPGGRAGVYSVPNGVTSIATTAFINCSSLTGVTIPTGVISIGDFAFQYCSLASVTIPNSVASIGEVAFSGCSNLTTITVAASNPTFSSVNGVLFNKNQTTLIQYPGGLTGAYVIPNSVTSIGDSSFLLCRVANVTIPNGVKNIEFDAFSDSGLTNVSIANSVTNIEVPAFAGCIDLKAIAVGASNPSYSSVGGVLFNKNQADLIAYPAGLGGVYAIPGNVTNIEDYAFFQSRLTGVTIPNSVTSFGVFAFSASRLASVTIPNGVKNIPADAFVDCDALTDVTIPGSVTNISFRVFFGCDGLTGIYFQGNAPALSSDAFLDAGVGAAVYYLAGTTGWGAVYGRLPTVTLNSQGKVVGSLSNVGFLGQEFGFIFNGTNNQVFVVEASPNLINPNWQPIQTNTLSGTTFNFTDPQWKNYSGRFYRASTKP